MRELFAGEQPPLGLHVFVPDFPAKAAKLVRNLREGRARLIQAALTVAAPRDGGDVSVTYRGDRP
jgi:hypothetical protein